MEGNAKVVVVMILLYYSLSTVTAAPINGNPAPTPSTALNYYPNTSACDVHELLEYISPQGVAILKYICVITQDNRQNVLNEIRADHIVDLSIVIEDGNNYFDFGNESFSKDLKYLTIYSYYPVSISSGAFMGPDRILSVEIYQKHDLWAMEIINTTMRRRVIHFSEFELGWLTPLVGLINLNLSHNSVERFPDMEFCHLKNLTYLDISSNKINSSEGLGIACISSKEPCTPCLPNIQKLSIANNPITYLNVNLSDNLLSLNISGCSLSSIRLGAVLTSHTEVLDISYNNLSSLVMEGQGDCNSPNLTHLYLQNNKLQHITAGFFLCVKHLEFLDLSRNRLSETTLIKAGLNHLTELERLYMSHNKVYTLQGDLMGNMANLQRFYCSGCGLTKIEDLSFTKLQSLTYVRLDNNPLHYVDGSTFVQLQSLQHLDLSNTQLTAIPDFSHSQPSLVALILDSNNITEINPKRLYGLSHLLLLSLTFNRIRHIPGNAFSSMPYLQRLDVSNNQLRSIEEFGLDPLFRLINLSLSNNFLAVIPPLKLNVKILENIDLSRNLLRNIQLEVSYTLDWVNLSFNDIAHFESQLSKLKKLRMIDLSHNKLRVLSEDDFLTNTQPRPQVLLQGNPLHCDCQMEWLLNTKFNRPYQGMHKEILQGKKDEMFNPMTNDFEGKQRDPLKRFYAEVADLNYLQCTTSNSGGHSTSLSTITTTDFVCPYKDECNDWKCYEDCCSKDPHCPCRGVCYLSCSCYHKHNHDTNYMNCTYRQITTLLPNGPTYVKQIYLDGNNLTTLSSDYLDFPELTALFVNKSNVFHVNAGAFSKMKILKFLDLHENHIDRIETNVFRNTLVLKELYLHDNNIHSIENNSFQDLLYLRTLKLHGNNLRYLNFSLFEDMTFLTDLTLHDNPWSCDWQFGSVFQKWLIKHYDMITDIERIYCMDDMIDTSWCKELHGPNARVSGRAIGSTNLTNQALIYIDFSIACNNQVKSITEVVSLAAAFAVFMIIVVVIYKNMLLIKVYLYNQFGVRFRREEKDNIDRPYDIFVVYAKQDERFILHHLLPELESGDKSYRICLESRDWPPGAATAETIITSVQKSKRTILLVSEHHFSTQWCEFSFEAGHYQVLLDKQIRLIIILADRKLQAEMNRTMKMYVTTNAFLVVGEKWFWKKLRYYLADNPRGSDMEVGREFRLMEVYKKQVH